MGSDPVRVTKWHRIRFMTPSDDDPRPIKFPSPGPFWITGYGGWGDKGFATIIAYFPDGREGELLDFWPEAEAHDWEGYDHQIRDEITFTDRFPKPDWWPVAQPSPATPTIGEPL